MLIPKRQDSGISTEGRQMKKHVLAIASLIILVLNSEAANAKKGITQPVGIEVPQDGAKGVTLAQGGRFGGWSHGYTYNFLGLNHYTVSAADALHRQGRKSDCRGEMSPAEWA
jgi:hypothetical protein